MSSFLTTGCFQIQNLDCFLYRKSSSDRQTFKKNRFVVEFDELSQQLSMLVQNATDEQKALVLF